MIDEILVQNFKSLREVRTGLERFTVLVGPNGSGKSSVLEALNAFSRGVNGNLRSPGDAGFQQYKTVGADAPIVVAARFGGVCVRFRSEVLDSQRKSVQVAAAWERGSTLDATSWVTLQQNPTEFSNSTMLNLSVRSLRTPTFNAQSNSTMAADGTGMHAATANIALEDQEKWQQLQRDVCSIIPSIRRLRHKGVNRDQPPMLHFDVNGDVTLRADQMSDGTLLLVGLLTALYAPDRPNLILLDDVDHQLHPKAQHGLVALLRRVLKQNPDLQIVATTHSPYLLDSMEPSEVRVTYLDEDGSTICRPLVDNPSFEKWKDEMAPGEMWSLFGEKWLTREEVVA